MPGQRAGCRREWAGSRPADARLGTAGGPLGSRPGAAKEGAAAEITVATAWYTEGGVSGAPRVLVAFSRDGGASYGRPVEVARRVLGRVDIAAAGGGRFVVTYLKAGDGLANPDAVWTARIVAPGYGPGTATPIAAVEPGRRSGRLSLVQRPDRSGSLHAMWTAEDGVRVGRAAGGTGRRSVWS